MRTVISVALFQLIFFSLMPATARAAALAPITQEEIEAILERNQVVDVSSSTLPADLKSRLGQAVASTTGAIKPAITETVNKAEQAIATATDQISSTGEKIKDNLQNMQAEAKSDLNNTLFGSIMDSISSIWKNIVNWFSNLFAG